jgi:hypothetical protein
MDPLSRRKFPRQFLAALSLRLRTFYAFLLAEYRTDSEELVYRAEEQLRHFPPNIAPQRASVLRVKEAEMDVVSNLNSSGWARIAVLI